MPCDHLNSNPLLLLLSLVTHHQLTEQCVALLLLDYRVLHVFISFQTIPSSDIASSLIHIFNYTLCSPSKSCTALSPTLTVLVLLALNYCYNTAATPLSATNIPPIMSLQDCNVLLAATGSVAAIRVPRLVNLLLKHGANVKLLLTKYASKFIELEAPLPHSVQVLSDSDEWHVWNRKSDPVLHIDLVKWAHIYLIAPLSANTMAKLANGLCDNLVTSVARAWTFDYKPLVVAPAMNTNMWKHPISKPQIQTLKSFGVRIIEPISKTLACGDTGVGAMQEPPVIVQTLIHLLASSTTVDADYNTP